MHEKERIHYLAHISKAIVELIPMKRPDKDQAKNNIDFAAELLKLAVKSRTPYIVRIQEAAQRFDLDRIVLFPCIVHGESRLFIRMYGGKIPTFCQYLGIPLFSDSDVQANPIYISQMEQQYGVALYERNKNEVTNHVQLQIPPL